MELQESLGFKEELCDDKVSAGINLLLEVLDVLLVGWAVGVPMGIA